MAHFPEPKLNDVDWPFSDLSPTVYHSIEVTIGDRTFVGTLVGHVRSGNGKYGARIDEPPVLGTLVVSDRFGSSTQEVMVRVHQLRPELIRTITRNDKPGVPLKITLTAEWACPRNN
jgi:hypothetical protein